jgi:hypothetical protein
MGLAKELLKWLDLRITDKWEQPDLVVHGFVNARMSIAIVCATHLCLRGLRVSASKISRRFQWEDSAGLGLFRSDYSHKARIDSPILTLTRPTQHPPTTPNNEEQYAY